jgi:dimeric dUTPase (all-alpha-NTP-PPase superfamily)
LVILDDDNDEEQVKAAVLEVAMYKQETAKHRYMTLRALYVNTSKNLTLPNTN